MKLILIYGLYIMVWVMPVSTVQGQSTEVVQLLLNVEKLAQFKKILKQMKQGYDILNGGYRTVKDLTEGNFTLHKTFFDELLRVSPEVKKYHKIGKIIGMQISILATIRSFQAHISLKSLLNEVEQKYMFSVLKNLLQESYENMDELLMILTDQVLSMEDPERLDAINGIYETMGEKVQFLKHFLDDAKILLFQRKRELMDSKSIRKQYGVNQEQ
ncbi:TerB family tellurite resistance protein [Sphingobacterium sp. HJSM2_6]|uniref:TerB family tellurite resistance protein n=1 Tax=Sphingobacterium sp. HJSM2_6 TaxID=3366264 RepID=UPI003BDFD6FF